MPGDPSDHKRTDNMLHMTGTVKCLVRDNLTGVSNADDQQEIMQSKCAEAPELLGCIRYQELRSLTATSSAKRESCLQRLRIDHGQPVAMTA